MPSSIRPTRCRILGTLGGATSSGNGINNSGQVTGSADVAGDHGHAFLYSDGVIHDLGTLGGPTSAGSAIDSASRIVGTAATGDVQSRAFLYSDGKMYDLNPLVVSGLGGATMSGASSINDSGQIIATGCLGEKCQQYRLDPLPNTPAGGGGGCAMVQGLRGGTIDPTLPLLLVLAVVWARFPNIRR